MQVMQFATKLFEIVVVVNDLIMRNKIMFTISYNKYSDVLVMYSQNLSTYIEHEYEYEYTTIISTCTSISKMYSSTRVPSTSAPGLKRLHMAFWR